MEQQGFLETERLNIRIDKAEDYIQAFNTLSDENLMLHFGFTNLKELETQKMKVKGGMSTYRTSFQVFQLIEKGTEQIVGSFGFHNWYPTHQRAEIGYAMNAEEHKQKGYMKEAMNVIIPYGFEYLKLNRMEALIHPDNTPSIKLVKHYAFTQEGLLKEHYYSDGQMGDSMLFALLRKEYEQIQPA
jgi:[ribosomal protein S5]-alanine N-acetyltransferase